MGLRVCQILLVPFGIRIFLHPFGFPVSKPHWPSSQTFWGLLGAEPLRWATLSGTWAPHSLGRNPVVVIILLLVGHFSGAVGFDYTASLPFLSILLQFLLYVFSCGKCFLPVIRLFSVIVVLSVQSLSRVRLFVTPWIAARQASLYITNSWSSPRLTSIESVIPSSHLILCRPLLLLPPIPPSIRVFSNESALCMRWPKY